MHSSNASSVLLLLLFVGCLISQQHTRVSQGQICSAVRAATLTKKVQIKLSTSPSHSILTQGQLVPALTLWCQAPGRVATGVPICKSLVWLDAENPHGESGNQTQVCWSQGRHLNHQVYEAVSSVQHAEHHPNQSTIQRIPSTVYLQSLPWDAGICQESPPLWRKIQGQNQPWKLMQLN